MSYDERFRRLEAELKHAVRVWVRFRRAWRPSRRRLAEQQRGVAAGILTALDLLGYGREKEEMLRQLDREFPSNLERWFGLTRDRYLPGAR
jgi:hypothetical protein